MEQREQKLGLASQIRHPSGSELLKDNQVFHPSRVRPVADPPCAWSATGREDHWSGRVPLQGDSSGNPCGRRRARRESAERRRPLLLQAPSAVIRRGGPTARYRSPRLLGRGVRWRALTLISENPDERPGNVDDCVCAAPRTVRCTCRAPAVSTPAAPSAATPPLP